MIFVDSSPPHPPQQGYFQMAAISPPCTVRIYNLPKWAFICLFTYPPNGPSSDMALTTTAAVAIAKADAATIEATAQGKLAKADATVIEAATPGRQRMAEKKQTASAGVIVIRARFGCFSKRGVENENWGQLLHSGGREGVDSLNLISNKVSFYGSDSRLNEVQIAPVGAIPDPPPS